MKIKKISKILLLSLASVCIAGSIFADTTLPKVKILGKSFYYYETKKDESLYGIAKRFGWDPEILSLTNKDVTSNPEKGTLLYYPVGKELTEEIADNAKSGSYISNETKEVSSPSSNSTYPLYHTVTADESLYGISKKYNLSIDRLIELNPNASSGAIHEGMVLRISPEEGIDRVEVENLTNENSSTNPTLALDSIQVASTDYVNSIGSDNGASVSLTNPEERAEVNIAVVLTGLASPDADDNEKRIKKNKEMEFARGALAGVDALKNSPFKTRLTIIDGNKDEGVVNMLLSEFAPRMIISSSDKGIPAYLVNYADSTNTMLVNALTTKDELYATDPNVVQFLAPTKYMNKEVADYITDKFADYTLLVAGNQDPNDTMGNIVIEEFAKLGNSKVIEIELANLANYSLPDDNGKYLIYVPLINQEEVQAALEKINELRIKNILSEIRVLGRPNWVPYVKKMKDLFGATYTYIPSRFYFDPSNQDTKNFIENYESLFSVRPMVSSPVYCATAYDIITYMAPNLAANSNNAELQMEDVATIQSPMSPSRVDNGGIVNKGIYIISFEPFGLTELVTLPEVQQPAATVAPKDFVPIEDNEIDAL